MAIRATTITRQHDGGTMQPDDGAAAISWSHLLHRLGDGGTFWLTTVDPAGRPHTRPVFAVVADGTLHVASSASASKTGHLRAGAPTSLGRGTPDLDIVWAGTPRRILDVDALTAVCDAYRDTYGWDVAVDPDAQALTAPYGAPTAGPPPYLVFRIDPRTVHAVATGTAVTGRSTRWDIAPKVREDRESVMVNAPAEQVFAALVDPAALEAWLPPAGMTGAFDHADIRQGGSFRLVLSPDDMVGPGKAGDGTDVVEARIVALMEDQQLVQAVDFASDDPAVQGTMTMTWTLVPTDAGTHVEVIATDVPPGIDPQDHSTGLRSSLANLAAHVTGQAAS